MGKHRGLQIPRRYFEHGRQFNNYVYTLKNKKVYRN